SGSPISRYRATSPSSTSSRRRRASASRRTSYRARWTTAGIANDPATVRAAARRAPPLVQDAIRADLDDRGVAAALTGGLMYANILFEKKDGIAMITLNRPRVLNALSRALKGEVSDALGRIAEDPSVRAVVLIGAGQAFSAGQDLNEAKDLDGAGAEEWVREYEA